MKPQLPAEPGELTFWIHVTPRARRPAVGGARDDALRVAVASPASEGRANAACIEALAEAFAVPRRAVSLRSGQRARRKRIRISGDTALLQQRLAELAAGDGLG